VAPPRAGPEGLSTHAHDSLPLHPAPAVQTLGSEVRALVHLAFPIAAAQLGITAMGLVDTAVLGRVSATELAGAAIGRSIGFGAITVAIGVSTGLEPLAAQAIGAGDPDRAWQAFKATLRAVLALSAPLLLAGYAVTFLLVPLGVPGPVVSRARDYVVTQSPGLALMVAFLAGKTLLQAHGKTRPALVASIVANVVNFAVCNLLVRGDGALVDVHLAPLGLPRLGAWGAGIAFSVAQVVLVAIVLSAVWPYRARREQPALAGRVVLRVGLPVGLQILAEYGVFAFAALLIGRFGAESESAHQIALGLASFTYMGALGVAGATSVRVGHAVGAGTSVRTRGFVGIAVGAGFMSIGALAFALVPGFLVRVFTDEPQVIALGIHLLGLAAIFQLFDGVQTVAGGALRGAGDVRFPFVATILSHWAVGFPLGILFAFPLGYGVRGMWWGLTSGLVTVSVALAWRFAVVSKRVLTRVA
jgi:MATE family multidrug resistance protein